MAQTTQLWYNLRVTYERVFLFTDIDPSFSNPFVCDNKSGEAGRRISVLRSGEDGKVC